MTWREDPEGRMLVLIFGLAFAGIVLMVAGSLVTNVVAFVTIIGMLLAFVSALVFVP